MKKKSIDYSGIPETDETFWTNAKVNLPKTKKSLTLRLDPDVINWFKKNGKGYQTKINAVLKAYVEAHERRGQ
ncbi:MAG: BrnA antitoxin family protein [Pseudomonadota bacterium]